jgi:hypothetical protein
MRQSDSKQSDAEAKALTSQDDPPVRPLIGNQHAAPSQQPLPQCQCQYLLPPHTCILDRCRQQRALLPDLVSSAAPGHTPRPAARGRPR